MKKIFLFLGLLALPCIGTAANKKIQMVTYFPTPYVAYSNVQATTALDIGLTGTCEMELGCDKSGLALRASSTVVVQKGTFDLNAAGRVQSETVTLGKGGGAGTFDFDADLVVTTLQNGQSVEATNMQVDNLYLFPSHTSNGGAFPVCDGGTMSWQSVGGKTHLVCGDAPEVQECTSHPYDTHEGSSSYYLGYGATINVAEVLSILTANEDLCCSGNKITDLDGTALSEDELEWYYQSGVCCNPKLCCTAGGDSGGSSTQCTSDFTNPNALKTAAGSWACGGDTQVFFYSCAGKGSTEPVCNWNSGEKKVLVDKKVLHWDGALFEAAGGDEGPGVSGPVLLNNITGFEDNCDRACSKLTDTCQEGYQMSNCRVGARGDDGVAYYFCTLTYTEKTCECN